jgi:hypothetical protein
VSLLTGADETNRRHIGFLAVVENEFAAPSSRVEVLPAHQAPSSNRLPIDRDDLDLLADEEGRKHRRDDIARELAWSAVGNRGRAQRQALRLLQAALGFEKLLQSHGQPRFGNCRERIAAHLPLLQSADDDGARGKIDHCSRTKGRNDLT